MLCTYLLMFLLLLNHYSYGWEGLQNDFLTQTSKLQVHFVFPTKANFFTQIYTFPSLCM